MDLIMAVRLNCTLSYQQADVAGDCAVRGPPAVLRAAPGGGRLVQRQPGLRLRASPGRRGLRLAHGPGLCGLLQAQRLRLPVRTLPTCPCVGWEAPTPHLHGTGERAYTRKLRIIQSEVWSVLHA